MSLQDEASEELDTWRTTSETPIYKQETPSDFKTRFGRVTTFAALTYFFLGSSANIGYKAVIIPSQVKLIVPPGSKELFNGLVSIPSTFADAFATPIAGAISDSFRTRIGRRHPVMMVGNVMAAFAAIFSAFFIFPLAGGDLWTFAGLAITAFAMECGNSISMGGFGGLGPEVAAGRVGLLAGLMAIGRSAGMLSSTTIAGFVLDYVPYPLNFILCYGAYAILLVSCWTVVYFFVREPKNTKVKEISIVGIVKSFWILKPGYFNFYMIFLNRFLFEMGTYSILNFIPYYFDDVHKATMVNVLSSLFLFIVLGIAGLVGPGSGIVSDCSPIPRKWFVFVAGLIASSSFLLFIPVTFFHLHISWFFVFSGILGIGVGVYLSVDWALAIDACPIEEDTAKDMGIWNLSSSIASLLSPFITGIMLDRLKRIMDIRYAWCFVYGTGAFWYFLSSVTLLLVSVKPRKIKDSPEEVPEENEEPEETQKLIE